MFISSRRAAKRSGVSEQAAELISSRKTAFPQQDEMEAQAPDKRTRSGTSRESVYVPVLLLQLQDDLARSRRREAFWISLVVHILLVVAIIAMPDLSRRSGVVALQRAEDLVQNRDYTFLELPPDVQKVTRRPDTNILSDKDRVASSRNPTLDRKTLEKILESQRPGPPGPSGTPAPPQPPSPPPVVAEARPNPSGPAAQPKEGSPPAPAPPRTNSDAPVLQSLNEAARQVMGGTLGGGLSPGSAIQQAARASAGNRTGGLGGDYGLRPGDTGGVQSHLDILSDTMGVDFGPYLTRVLHLVRINWYNLIPEVARAPLMKKGKVSVEFAITREGQVAGMRLSESSGDVALDRAAWGGITASNPFPPLPGEFHGSYLALRFHFYYNPDKGEIR
jgi:TonB family protein